MRTCSSHNLLLHRFHELAVRHYHSTFGLGACPDSKVAPYGPSWFGPVMLRAPLAVIPEE
jgi:hypothetical protein